jgi:hypothetical protein
MTHRLDHYSRTPAAGRTAVAGAFGVYAIAVLALIAAFLAFSSRHLYLGSMAMGLTVVAAVVGSLLILSGAVRGERVYHRRRHPRRTVRR